MGKKQNLLHTPDNINFRIIHIQIHLMSIKEAFLPKDGDIDYSKVVAVTSKNNVVNKLEDQLNASNLTSRNEAQKLSI